jgi:hypothetical protein
MLKANCRADYQRRGGKAAITRRLNKNKRGERAIADWITAGVTARWAVTMTKVGIRRVMARTRWQLVTFLGKAKHESVGVVDLVAIRKDHGKPEPKMKRGDTFQIILIQVKGGAAPMPTVEDGIRLHAVAKRHHACDVLLGAWARGKAVEFFKLRRRTSTHLQSWHRDWQKVENLEAVFR